MVALKLPPGLKAAQLKHAAFLMGLPISGTKSELESGILSRLNAPALLPKPTRIVSIDMGIKNLGLCVLENTTSITPAAHSDSPKSKLKILDWKRLDVLDHVSQRTQIPMTSEGSDPRVLRKARRIPLGSPKSTLIPAAFTPSALSKTAFTLTTDILHTYTPDHVLIERQRFRSGGAAAVQEWTLRVNMLESMIWACLETLRSTSGSDWPVGDVQVYEVSPARVAKFWDRGSPRPVVPDTLFVEDWKEPGKSTSYNSKVDREVIVNSWVAQYKWGPGNEDLALDFSDEAMEVVNSFTSPKRKATVKGKLDDLADSLLQGAAWVRWEENRQRILRLLS